MPSILSEFSKTIWLVFTSWWHICQYQRHPYLNQENQNVIRIIWIYTNFPSCQNDQKSLGQCLLPVGISVNIRDITSKIKNKSKCHLDHPNVYQLSNNFFWEKCVPKYLFPSTPHCKLQSECLHTFKNVWIFWCSFRVYQDFRSELTLKRSFIQNCLKSQVLLSTQVWYFASGKLLSGYIFCGVGALRRLQKTASLRTWSWYIFDISEERWKLFCSKMRSSM